MGLGVGVLLVVLGLVFLLGVIEVDLPAIEDTTLGWILLLGGLAAIVLGLVASRSARTTRTVEERRLD